MNLTAARRPYHLARHLADNGHLVSVVTQQASACTKWDADLEGIVVIRFPVVGTPSNYTPLQKLLSRIFWATKGTVLSRITQLLADLLLPLNPMARMEIDTDLIERQVGQPQVVIATGPSWSMFEIGQRLASLWKSTYIIDYRDPWNVLLPEVGLADVTFVGTGWVGRLRRWRNKLLEKRYTTGAHGVTGATPPLLENAALLIGEHPSTVVFNGHTEVVHGSTHPRNELLTLAYTGSVYQEQEWAILSEALALIEKEQPTFIKALRIVLVAATYPSGKPHPKIQELLRYSCVEAIPRLDRDATMTMQSNADLLLHVGFKNKKGILPIKFLEYINSGVPILQLSSGRDIQEDILDRTRTGRVLSCGKELAEHLIDCHKYWSRSGTLPYEPDLASLAEFTWTHQMEHWRKFVLGIHQDRSASKNMSSPHA